MYEVRVNITGFKKGDRAVGQVQRLLKGAPEDGAFSLYTRLPSGNADVIPSRVSFKDASVLPVAIGTASRGLNEAEHLNQPVPSTNSKLSGTVIVLYGDSMSIGSMTIQLATAAGIRVISVASSKNFDFCCKCGPSDVFDHKDSSIVDDVVKAVGKITFAGIYNTISSEDSFKICLAVL